MALCVAALGAPGAATAETGTVKIAHRVDRDSGRLVLEFPKRVDYAAERVGNDIYMRFSQPIASDIEPARRTLARYVSDMRVAGGGRVLVIRMAGQPRMTHSRRGNAVTIIWIGPGQAEPATAEKPSATKPPDNKTPDSKTPDNKPAEPSAAEKPGAPKAPVAPKAAETPPAPPKTAEAPPSPKAAPAAPKADEKPATPPKAAEAPPAPKALDKPAVPPAAPPEPKAAEKPAPPKADPPVKKPEKAPSETKRADATPPTPPSANPPAAGADPAGPTVGPALAVSNNGTETRIAATWPEPTAAAVFRHGDTVWMIFPRRQAFDLATYQKRLGPGVDRLTRQEHAEATVLTARVRAGMTARVTRERNTWTIALKPGAPAASENDLKLVIARGANEHVSVALAGAETPIRIADPDSGSILFVVPSRAPASAAGERRFVTFRLVAAAQGAVVEALADGLSVAVDGGALVIRRSGGLLISGSPAPGLPPQGQ